MPLFTGQTFFSSDSGNLETFGLSCLCTSPVLSVETRRGCVYCECIHSETPGPFISFFIEVDVVIEPKATPGNKRGEDVVEFASLRCLWICTICFSCMFEWELLYILMFMFVCSIVLLLPRLSLVLLPFLVLFFFNLVIFSQLLLLLLHHKYYFIILCYFHLATLEARCALQKMIIKPLCIHIYRLHHDCKIWMFADLNGIFLSMKKKCYWGLVFKRIFF